MFLEKDGVELLDVYFEEKYGKIYELNGEGELKTFRLENENGSVDYKFLKREIPFTVGGQKYFDIATPYGYGGPLFLNCSNFEAVERLKIEFQKKFSEYCKKEDIVSEFIRFHPIIKNHEFLRGIVDVVYKTHTICIEIGDEGKILENLTSTCRNRIKKSIEDNVIIKIEDNIENFYDLYIETMKRNCAYNYYFFSREFFENTLLLLEDRAKIFSAYIDGIVIASMLIIHGGEYMHYHFIGSDCEHRNLSANNLLVFEAAKWGSKNGKRYFHLGGGYHGDEDSLYHFKSTFTKGEPYEFYVGKKIHNEKIYNELVEARSKISDIKNREFFPLYRAD
ncbi:MAG: lipid II:glycine glycyltransferase FemX [Fusobacteriaceae bacterium]